MIRYYLDSNIYRLMKKEHPSHNPNLLETVDNLKDKVLFIFSDGHLDDLKNSVNPYRDSDLEFMGVYTKDNYYAVDLDLELALYLADPLTAFNGKDYKAVDEFYSNPSKISNIFDQLGDEPAIRQVKQLFHDFLNRPLSSLHPPVDLEKIDIEDRDLLSRLLPNYSTEMTVKEFVEKQMEFSVSFKDDKKELRKMRNFIGKNFNRDDYSWDKWKQRFDVKLKDTKLKKTFSELLDAMPLADKGTGVYRKITNAYTLLEYFNITEERSKGKLKPFTFSSLHQDAQHVFYAAYTDYLVTDDRGMQLKAAIVYEMLGMSTEVLSVTDFINRNHQLQFNEETYESFINALNYDLLHAMELIHRLDPISNKVIRTLKTSHSYFNYFNRIQLISEGEHDIILYCERGSPAKFIMFRENELIVNKLIRAFGDDDERKGKYHFNEEKELPLYRVWKIAGWAYELATSDHYISLFIKKIEY